MSLSVRLFKTTYNYATKLYTKPKALANYSAAASQGSQKTEQVVLKEHGLSEIMSESAQKSTAIGQTPVHSPIIPKPVPRIEVQGHTIKCPKGRNGYYTRYKIIETEDKLEKFVKFLDDDGNAVGNLVPLDMSNYTSKMSREEFLKAIKEPLKKFKPKTTTSTPTEPQGTWLEKTIKTLQEPKGTVDKLVRLDEEGNTIVRFLDKDGSFIRKVKVNPNGRVLEYSNYRTLISGQGIKGAHLSNRRSSSSIRGEGILSDLKFKFDEAMSHYMRVMEESKYILDTNGEVVRTIQTRKFTPHKYGKVGDFLVATTVDTRSMGNGKFVEDVVITKGDKRFGRSYWFDQKSGNVHTMDGWCKGLTKEEIELIKSDSFLASRYYNDPLDFIRTEKFNGYKTQQLRDMSTQLTFDAPHGSEGGYYSYKRRRINVTPKCVTHDNKPWMVDTMHHEPRHGFQHQMVDDLNAGLLEGEEKVQAQIFKDNFANYISIDTDRALYMGQPVEVDARKAGEAAAKQFEENGEKIDHIFFDVA